LCIGLLREDDTKSGGEAEMSHSKSGIKKLGLRKNFSWALIGTLISTACQWMILMVMAKLLPIEEVGYYALALAIATPVIMFSMLQLRAVLFTDVQSRYRFGDYLGVRLVTNSIAAVTVLFILIYLGGRYDITVHYVIFFVLINKAIESTSDMSYGLMQKHERLDKAAQSRIYRNVVAVILVFLALYFTHNLLLGVLAIGLWWLLILLLFDRRNVKRFEPWIPRFNLKNLLHIMWLGLPMGIARGIISLNTSTPRYFIETHMGVDSLGVFAAMAYTVIGSGRIIEALGYSAGARLAKYFRHNRRAYLRLLVKMIAMAILMASVSVLVGTLFGEEILTVLYNKDYAKHPDVFFWLLIVAGGNMISSMLNYGMISARRFKSLVPLSILFFSVCFVGCWFLIPTYGMKGAAWAMLLSIISRIMCSLVILAWAIKSPLNSVSGPSAAGR